MNSDELYMKNRFFSGISSNENSISRLRLDNYMKGCKRWKKSYAGGFGWCNGDHDTYPF